MQRRESGGAMRLRASVVFQYLSLRNGAKAPLSHDNGMLQEEIPQGLPLRPSKAQCAWWGNCPAWLTLASYSVTTDILATAGHILAAAESSIRYEPTTSRLMGPPQVPGSQLFRQPFLPAN